LPPSITSKQRNVVKKSLVMLAMVGIAVTGCAAHTGTARPATVTITAVPSPVSSPVVQATAPPATSAPATHEINGTLVIDDFSDLALSPVETANGFKIDGYDKLGNDNEQLRFLDALTAGTTYSCADGLGDGFGDITTATGVTVTDGNNQVIATGVLTGGVMDTEGCHFDFQITVPDTAFYQITVSHRGALTYSFAQMQAAAWQVSSKLG
jgi:hypothetical protein